MADSTMSFILCLYRKPHLIGFGARRIANSVLGLIGLDAIGLAVVDRARSHRFRIIFYDPNAPIGIDHALGIERMSSVEQLISIADCVSLHCDYRHNNFRCIINSHTLMQFKRGKEMNSSLEIKLPQTIV
jgi:C-terminal binding protein